MFSSFHRALARIRAVFQSNDLDRDLVLELESHIQILAEQHTHKGASQEEAQRLARIELGGIEQLREAHREVRGLPLLDTVLQDIRFAFRMFRRSPGFTVVAVLTLAIGIGATTSIFSVIKAVILNPLPFRQPEKLVDLWENDHVQHYRRGDQAYFSSVRTGVFYEWRAQCQSFESMSAYHWRDMLFGGERGAELVEGQEVMDQFFETLGVRAQLGRTFEPADYAPNAPHTTILGHRMWVEQFGKDPEIIGRRISLDRESYEIVGVMPEGFFPTPWHYPELWTPHWADAKEKQDRNAWGHFVIARLKPEVSWEQAQAELDVASVRIAKNHLGEQEVDATVVPMDSELIGSSWKLLLLLGGGVVLLLLIACVNVANLLLARVTDRQKEFSVRSALGAGRWRLISQLFMESCALSLAAGLVGIAVASAGTQGLLRLLPTSANLARLVTVKTDAGVLAFGFGLALLVTLLSSLAPWLRISRNRTAEILKSEGRSSSSGKTRQRVRQLFAVSEFVLSLVLLILGTLLVQSFLKLQRADPGFDTSKLLTFRITVPQVSYGKFVYGEKDARRQRLYEQLEQTLGAVPGVDALAFAGHLPLAHEFNASPVHVEDHAPLPGHPGADGAAATGSEGDTGIQYVNPEYFHALRLRLMSGRLLDERDAADKPLAAVINDTFARTFFPNEDPIGKRVTVWFAKPTIVGVVADFKLNSIDRKPLPEIFWSLRQVASPNIWVLVRSRSNPFFLSAALRQKVRDLDSDLPVQDLRLMSGVIADSLWLKRISALLVGLVAALAIIVAGAGIYSVMSYFVSQRTREVGIRVALGANRNEILSLLVGETCRLALLGSVIGSVAAYFVGRVATNQMYLSPEFASSQIPTGPLSTGVFLVCSLFLFGVALFASYVPARRALAVDPVSALRHE
jgi:putative ABC transport system permease protein